MKLDTYIELECTIDYTISPASRGHRDSYGAPLEPDEPEEIEINSVEINGQDILGYLSGKQITELIKACFEDARDQEGEV
jgi:hypothetical protein